MSVFQSHVHSHYLPSMFDILHDPRKKVNDLPRQEFSQLRVSDLMSLIFCSIIVLMDDILCNNA